MKKIKKKFLFLSNNHILMKYTYKLEYLFLYTSILYLVYLMFIMFKI